jgi:putative addiction module component (TIGR02574 family)
MTKAELASILELSVAERLQLAQDIWDSNAADASSLPLTEAQRRMLDERLAAYRADPEAGSTWEVVRARIRKAR